MTSVSEKFGEWLEGLEAASIPEAPTNGAIDTLIDTAGLSFAARDTDYMQALVKGWESGEGKATVLGHAGGFDAITAAMLNGTAAHGEDFDNSYEGCPVHSGAVIVPAVLAIAEARGLTGERAFTGIVAGIEIMCRMGQITGTGAHKAGFHPTAIIGTMAAAGAVGVALGQNRDQIANGFGLAGSMAAGIIEYLADGSWTKRMHAGWAAQSGIRAATMAEAGFIGPKTVFEGTHGFYTAFAPSIEPDFDVLVSDLGQRWEAANLSFKPYACGTMCQPYVDCAIRMRDQITDIDAIASISCKVGEGTVHRLWAPLELKQNPPTGYGAKFSGPYCLAIGLIDGDAGLAQFSEEKIHGKQVLELASKIAYDVDPDNEYPANYTGHMEITLKDGTTMTEFQPYLRGGTKEPLGRDAIIDKCHANLSFGGMANDRISGFIETFETLALQSDLSALRAFRG
mgnify:FL=1